MLILCGELRVKTPHSEKRKWTEREKLQVSKLLLKCNNTLPCEIHRAVRPLNELKNWKGTEFRTFLLYIGVVILKDHLTEAEYKMFLNLFCGVTICSSHFYARYLPLARNLFNDFIENAIEIFGESNVTINMHNLSHVVDDVENFGPLHTLSACECENCLYHLKINIQQGRKPLQQIARRAIEQSLSKTFLIQPDHTFPQLNHRFLLDGFDAFREIMYKSNVKLSSVNENEKNKWFLTYDNNIVQFDYVKKNHGKLMIFGSAFKSVGNFFERPFQKFKPFEYLCC